MYEVFFGLKTRPFSAVPHVSGYYPATACETARHSLARCIDRGEGIGLVIGPVGTGKTLLCQKLAEQFSGSFQVVLLASGRISTRRSLFQAILYELGQPYRGMDEGELRLALVDSLMLNSDQTRGLLLIVDEAHTLPLRLLDEIRMLTNLARAGQPLVRLVLAGGSALEERLASPKLDSFNSRIASRCYLEAFNRTETIEYVQGKMQIAGASSVIFTDDACQNVFQATDGVPRLINQLCDHALLVAYTAGQRHIEAVNIEDAWADLQQLPTPWNGDHPNEKPGVIEFGHLDDLPDDDSLGSIKLPAPSLRINAESDESDFESAEHFDSIPPIVSAPVDFEPGNSLQNEIELVFDNFEHPFKEEFEQEEIVSDRYPGSSPTFSSLQANAALTPVESWAASPVSVRQNVEPSKDTLPLHKQSTAVFDPENNPVLVIEENSTAAEVAVSRSIRPVRSHEFNRLFAKLRHG